MSANMYFNPGCALSLYKPEFESKILRYLNENYKETILHKICCHHDPKLLNGSKIINICAGCDRRFRSLYNGITTISFWEILDKVDNFPYPNYNGLELSIHDPCPIRDKPDVHNAVRNLLKKMNISIREVEFIKEKSICCGDDLYNKTSIKIVNENMIKRASSMPCDEVCVYCVSCIKAMYIGTKKPRYLLDLLFNENTDPQEYNTVKWHDQLEKYIELH